MFRVDEKNHMIFLRLIKSEDDCGIQERWKDSLNIF